MHSFGRNRHRTRMLAARRLTPYLLACCLAAGCAGGPSAPAADRHRPGSTSTESAPGHSASASPPSPSPDRSTPQRPDRTATDPATLDAAALAGQLADATAILADEDASTAELRRAGEFQQLAIRELTGSSAGFRRTVLNALDPQTADLTRDQIRAAEALSTISGPAEEMPDWKVVSAAPPEELLDHYRAAERRTGVPWEYLAAINLVETRMGRIRGQSTAGAQGPMQFVPSTWEIYGEGGDIDDDRDAILAAARLLADNGAPDDMDEALWHYNPAEGYVTAVKLYARTMQESEPTYRGYWQWRVLYGHERGTFVLPVGYPRKPAERLDPADG